jgi:hypothetical protein
MFSSTGVGVDANSSRGASGGKTSSKWQTKTNTTHDSETQSSAGASATFNNSSHLQATTTPAKLRAKSGTFMPQNQIIDEERPSIPQPPAAITPAHRHSIPNLPVNTLSHNTGPQLVTTTVMKGEHGLGLDLAKNKTNQPVINGFKDLPNNLPNPARNCVPPIQVGDVIIAVNGESCDSFTDAVRLIRATSGAVTLRVQRLHN